MLAQARCAPCVQRGGSICHSTTATLPYLVPRQCLGWTSAPNCAADGLCSWFSAVNSCQFQVARVLDARSLSACAGGKCCPLTGLPLEGWVMLVSNEGLRREIQAWACSVGLDLDALADVAYRSSSAPSACGDLARSCTAVGTTLPAGKRTGAQHRQHTRRSWYSARALHLSAQVLVALSFQPRFVLAATSCYTPHTSLRVRQGLAASAVPHTLQRSQTSAACSSAAACERLPSRSVGAMQPADATAGGVDRVSGMLLDSAQR